MKKEIIIPDNIHKTRGYAHAVRVGYTLYVSGQISVDENNNVVGINDFNEQVNQALENLKRVLTAAGTSMKDVVKTTIYFRDMEDLPKFREARKKYLGDHVASTVVEINKLARPELLIEIEAIAIINQLFNE